MATVVACECRGVVEEARDAVEDVAFVAEMVALLVELVLDGTATQAQRRGFVARCRSLREVARRSLATIGGLTPAV